MDISRFKQQHQDIVDGIDELRKLSHAGIAENAVAIAAKLHTLSNVIIQHLAIEDRLLYPRLARHSNPRLVALGQRFQTEMTDVANPFIHFSRKWQQARAIATAPEEFRADANTVLRRVYERLREEDREFYPIIEASTA